MNEQGKANGDYPSNFWMKRKKQCKSKDARGQNQGYIWKD